jgi:signal transduction histidine kinase
VLRHVVEAARELVGARYAALGVVAPDGTLREFVYTGMDAATAERIDRLPRVAGLLGLLSTGSRPVRVADLDAHPAAAGFPAAHPPMRSFLGVPIRVRDVVFGNLYLTESADGEFSAEDEQLIVALAASAGVAIENARLFGQVARQRQWLTSTTELTQQLHAGSHEDPMALVLRHAAAGAGADSGQVVVPINDRQGQVRAQLGDLDGVREGQILDFESAPSGRILRGVGATLVDDGHPRTGSLDETARPLRSGSMAGVPLAAPDGTVLGVLLVGRNPDAVPFDEHELRLLASFGTQAGHGLALARARTGRESLLLLAEHERIAADLHDHVIQELFAIGMGLHGMVHHQSSPPQQQRLLGYVDALDQTVRRIRTTIFTLKRRPGDARSLRAQLLTVLDDERPALGFAARIDFSGALDLDVPDDVADDVVAVVREALSNVARHARARNVDVGVSLAGPLLEIAVVDDGAGLGGVTRSSGLSNLRRRAEAHAGTFRIWSPQTGGTHLRWTAHVDRPQG